MKIKLLFSPRYNISVVNNRRMQIPMLAPLGIATLTAYLRQQGYHVDQDDLMVKADRFNRSASTKEKILLRLFEDEARLDGFLEDAETEAHQLLLKFRRRRVAFIGSVNGRK